MTKEERSERCRQAALKRWAKLDPDERKSLVKSIGFTNKGCKHTDEAKAKIKAARAKQHQTFDEKARHNMSEGQKRYWAGLSKEEREEKVKRYINARVNKSKDTSIELIVEDQLKNLGIEYEKQKYCKNKRLNKYFVIDFYVPKYKDYELFIECNGDYWHGPKNPNRQERDSILKDAVENQIKSNKHSNLRLITLWEHDIKINKNLLKEKLDKLLNL